MSSAKQARPDTPCPCCHSAAEARELIAKTLRDDFAAGSDPEPDDVLQSDLDWPGIQRLRAVIQYLKTLP